MSLFDGFYKKCLLKKGKCRYILSSNTSEIYHINGDRVLYNVTVTHAPDGSISLSGSEKVYDAIVNFGNDGKYLDYVNTHDIPDEYIIKTMLWLIPTKNNRFWTIQTGWYPRKELEPFEMKFSPAVPFVIS